MFSNQYFKYIDQRDFKIALFGMQEQLKSRYLYELFNKSDEGLLLVTHNLYHAERLYESIQTYTDKVLFFPMDEFIASEALAASPEFKSYRIETLNKLVHDEHYIVITHLLGGLRYLPNKELWKSLQVDLEEGSEYSYDKLKRLLPQMGYKKSNVVNTIGEYAVRGDLIDLYPAEADNPIRLEFWGDEVDSIRTFDSETQLTLEKGMSISFGPFTETIFEDVDKGINYLKKFDEVEGIDEIVEMISEFKEYDQYHKFLPYFNEKIESISDYMSDSTTIFIDYNMIQKKYLMLNEEIEDWYEGLLEENRIIPGIKYIHDFYVLDNNKELFIEDFDTPLAGIKLDDMIRFQSIEAPMFYQRFDEFISYVEKKKGYTFVIALHNKKTLNKVYEELNEKAVIVDSLDEVRKGYVNLVVSELNGGFEWVEEQLIVITEKELFKAKNKKKSRNVRFANSEKIRDVKRLQPGDFVVHQDHGIGQYVGVVTLTQQGLLKDFLHIAYKGNDKLYIPVDQINLIQKYAGSEQARPKIHKLGGTEWHKTKQSIKKRVKDIAAKLLKITAERELANGFACGPDSDAMNDFESDFPHDETKDQLNVIAEIKQDMENKAPMDRLVCGDVGYGKTEVALRAAFKAIDNGKQVAFLCPTTILSKQHYETAMKRFENFPVNIALVNRFTTGSRINEIKALLETGGIDFVIGTHRLLNSSFVFKDIGLVVVDEEQRFGVEHKEKLKEMKTNVDVLTLSATPIPRTLQMGMFGLRNLSLLETPPKNRYPIQTYVIEENKTLIKDAIERELGRGGQVFILHNRTSDIEKRMRSIQKLVPFAKVTFAHGKMGKKELEERMIDFINHEYDVLVSTTIIETGIDIPNANTLIIFDADKFGLSQLYQIRGRVGRSDRIAYSYLMYQPKKVLTELAAKRLKAIKDFTQLGSGFKIAMRDLGIRGAGDILGSEQAGFIDTVGIEMYTRMLESEVKVLKGIPIDEEETPAVLNITTHIPDQYLDSSDLKIEVHQKVNEINNMDEYHLLYDELSDRFGEVPEDVDQMMKEVLLKRYMGFFHASNLKITKNSVSVDFDFELFNKLHGEKFLEIATNTSRFIRFSQQKKHLQIIVDTIKIKENWLSVLLTFFDAIEKELKGVK